MSYVGAADVIRTSRCGWGNIVKQALKTRRCLVLELNQLVQNRSMADFVQQKRLLLLYIVYYIIIFVPVSVAARSKA